MKLNIKQPLWAWVVMAGILAGFCCSGCQPEKKAADISSTGGKLEGALDPAQLRLQLWRVLDQAFIETVSTASEIASATKDRRVRENTLRWKIRVHDAMQAIRLESDPRMAFLRSWIWAVQARTYLTEGKWSGMFGDYQSKAIRVVTNIEDEIVALGERSFSHESIEAAMDDIAEMGKQDTADPVNGTVPKKSIFSFKERGDLGKILTIPLLPMGGLQGVADTPQAIQQFTHTARDFSTTVHHLPERTRWQLELLMLELESLESVQTTLAEMEKLNKSMDAISQTAERLPSEVRSEFEKSLKALEKSQPQLQATLQDADKTLAQMTMAAQAWQTTAAEIKAVLNELHKDDPQEQAEPQEKTSIADYTVMAERIEAAAQEVRQLLADLNQPAVEGGQASQATVRIRELVDLLFWRVIVLVLIILVALLGYRLIVIRARRIDHQEPIGTSKL